MSYGVHPYLCRFDTLRARETRHLDGYGLRALVEEYGDMLVNDRWSAMRGSWFDAVDTALAAAGAEVSVLGYFYRSPALAGRLAYRDDPATDFPAVGHVMRDEAGSLLERLEVPLGGEEGESVEQLRQWLRLALRSEADLITFYH